MSNIEDMACRTGRLVEFLTSDAIEHLAQRLRQVRREMTQLINSLEKDGGRETSPACAGDLAMACHQIGAHLEEIDQRYRLLIREREQQRRANGCYVCERGT